MNTRVAKKVAKNAIINHNSLRYRDKTMVKALTLFAAAFYKFGPNAWKIWKD